MSFCITRYVSDDLEKSGQGQIGFEMFNFVYIVGIVLWLYVTVIICFSWNCDVY